MAAPPSGAEAQAPATTGSSKKPLLIAVTIAVLLSAGLTAGLMWWLRPAAVDPQVEVEAVEAAAAAPAPAIYYPLRPALLVNFPDRGRQRYLQAEITLLTRDASVISSLELHQPMLRNALVMLISGRTFTELQSAEGKELLRQACLQELQRLLTEELGNPAIENLLFTSLVMQ